MPLPKGTRYRYRTMPSGKKVRLAFAKGSNRVLEAKSVTGSGPFTAEEMAQGYKVLSRAQAGVADEG